MLNTWLNENGWIMLAVKNFCVYGISAYMFVKDLQQHIMSCFLCMKEP